MEICELRTDNTKAPVSGNAIYIVVEESNQRVSLFYPWTLEEFTLPREEYVEARKAMLWPENQTTAFFDVNKVIKTIENKVQFFLEQKRSIPTRTITRCLATLKGVKIEEIEQSSRMIAAVANKGSDSREIRQYALVKKLSKDYLGKVKGRRREILEVLMKGPATVTAIADGIKYTPKLKVAGQDLTKAKEREILWVLRQNFISKGVVKVVE
jgi:hypothetical protein